MTSVVTGSQPRALADRCPGLLRPHRAEDGLLVRLRIPGGRTTSEVLLALSEIAADLGEGSLQLTSRGNLQLRGLTERVLPELVERVAGLGLLPSVTHERVRNLIASPLTGVGPGNWADLRPMVSELDAAVCGTAELAELPGRFLFALDDGRGDVSALRFDLAYRAEDTSGGTVLVGDARHGIPATRAEAVDLMVALAVQFVRLRNDLQPPPWHLSELVDLSAVDRRIRPLGPLGPLGPAGSDEPARTAVSPAPPLGALAEAASVGVPLSLLDRTQVDAIHAAAGGGPVVLTPWRGLVIPDAARALPALAAAGLIVDDDSIWSQLTGCIGAPGCARSAISTRSMATELAAQLSAPPARPVHLSGCSRRCGAPSTTHLDLVAPESTAQARATIEGALSPQTQPVSAT